MVDRYYIFMDSELDDPIENTPDGDWVKHEDYARLAAEVEKLNRHLEIMKDGRDEYYDRWQKSKAEVEKMRDALEDIASGELGINVSIKRARKALKGGE